MRRLSAQVLEALYIPVEQRVVRRLADLAEIYDHGVTPIDVGVKQEDLATMAGTTRPTANRMLHQLVGDGLIGVRRSHIEVFDLAGLQRRAADWAARATERWRSWLFGNGCHVGSRPLPTRSCISRCSAEEESRGDAAVQRIGQDGERAHRIEEGLTGESPQLTIRFGGNSRGPGRRAQAAGRCADQAGVGYRNGWGDALYVVTDDVEAAADVALQLQEAMSSIQLEACGLPALQLRIGMHAGPMFALENPVRDEPSYFGEHVTRAAHIEPVAPPGAVYVTSSFAAIIALERPDEFVCEYVGQVPTAKSFGPMPMHLLRRRRALG